MTEDELILRIQKLLEKHIKVEPDRFISEEEARKMLNCGKTQMYYYRINGVISYVQDDKFPKLILYDRVSINNYLFSKLKRAFRDENIRR